MSASNLGLVDRYVFSPSFFQSFHFYWMIDSLELFVVVEYWCQDACSHEIVLILAGLVDYNCCVTLVMLTALLYSFNVYRSRCYIWQIRCSIGRDVSVSGHFQPISISILSHAALEFDGSSTWWLVTSSSDTSTGACDQAHVIRRKLWHRRLICDWLRHLLTGYVFPVSRTIRISQQTWFYLYF